MNKLTIIFLIFTLAACQGENFAGSEAKEHYEAQPSTSSPYEPHRVILVFRMLDDATRCPRGMEERGGSGQTGSPVQYVHCEVEVRQSFRTPAKGVISFEYESNSDLGCAMNSLGIDSPRNDPKAYPIRCIGLSRPAGKTYQEGTAGYNPCIKGLPPQQGPANGVPPSEYPLNSGYGDDRNPQTLGDLNTRPYDESRTPREPLYEYNSSSAYPYDDDCSSNERLLYDPSEVYGP